MAAKPSARMMCWKPSSSARWIGGCFRESSIHHHLPSPYSSSLQISMQDALSCHSPQGDGGSIFMSKCRWWNPASCHPTPAAARNLRPIACSNQLSKALSTFSPAFSTGPYGSTASFTSSTVLSILSPAFSAGPFSLQETTEASNGNKHNDNSNVVFMD